MKQASLLQRLGTYLLGLVDEYWAMRRPWQYGNKQPQCGLNATAAIASAATRPAQSTRKGWRPLG